MSTTEEALTRAREFHQAGELTLAEQLYREIVQQDPSRALAWYRLGAVCQALDKLDEAESCFRQVLSCRPGHPGATNDLAVTLARQGRLAEAVAGFREALRFAPDDQDVRHNLGRTLARLGNWKEAADCFRLILEARPDEASVHHDLGLAMLEGGEADEAALRFVHALALQPNSAEALNNLGLALIEQEKWDEAVASFRQALHLVPDSTQALSNLGTALAQLGELAEAETCHRRALELRPDLVEAHNNLGNVLRDQGRYAEALAGYEEALRLQPDSANAHYNRALVWLLQGRFEEGWPEYEDWRWRRKEYAAALRANQRWDGSPLPGRTILLTAEGGLGDVIQFVRYAPLVKERVSTVLLECPSSLLRLLTGCRGVERLAADLASLPPFDVHAPLLSLPHLLGTTLATIPAGVPYLSADAARVEFWRRELRDDSSFKIGIVWQGNPRLRFDRRRSLPLASFAPLTGVPGVQLFSLQKGPGQEQRAALAGRFPVVDLGGRVDEEPDGAFLDTAAIMKCLDLVIVPDTSLAHLAGALAVPVWLALPFAPADWRWLLERTDSPWYPTMRLFRQRRPGAWETVFERMAEELRDLLGGRGSRLRSTRAT